MTALLMTRRMWTCLLAGATVSTVFRNILAADLTRVAVTWDAVPAPEAGQERHYRATAQILLLSLPLVRWPNVGGGSATWRETALPDGGTLRFLEFTGFSHPEHAAGLNRLGFIREIARVGAGVADSLYFGLMTASPEETAEEARKALHPKDKVATYTAIDGRLTGGEVETLVAHFVAPAQWSVANQSDLVQLAHKALATAAARRPEAAAHGKDLRPFLETLAAALPQNIPTEARFTYAGRLYQLSTQRSDDMKATASFRQRGLVPAIANVVRVSGKVRHEASGKETNFRLWIEDGAQRPMPLRIEYQAKSYLRLIFEAES